MSEVKQIINIMNATRIIIFERGQSKWKKKQQEFSAFFLFLSIQGYAIFFFITNVLIQAKHLIVYSCYGIEREHIFNIVCICKMSINFNGRAIQTERINSIDTVDSLEAKQDFKANSLRWHVSSDFVAMAKRKSCQFYFSFYAVH